MVQKLKKDSELFDKILEVHKTHESSSEGNFLEKSREKASSEKI